MKPIVNNIGHKGVPVFFSIVLFCLFSFSDASAQVITTVAGNGIRGYNGDGGMATATQLFQPLDIDVDKKGNIYFIDGGNYCVRKVNTAGIVSVVAGIAGICGVSGDNGPATNAKLGSPMSIALDSKGNLYISELSECRIRKVDTAGTITNFAGTSIRAFGGDGGPATAAHLFLPFGIATDKEDNVYICDAHNNRIRKVDTAGIISTVAGNGHPYFSGDSAAATASAIGEPYSIAFDTSGNLFFADYSRIRKINTAGILTTVAGNGTLGYSGDGGPATAASITNHGIAIDSLNNIYFSDALNNRIHKVSPTGIITTVAGTGDCSYNGDNIAATTAKLCVPNGLATDRAGSLYIADQNNNRIRKIRFDTTISLGYDASGVQLSADIFPNPMQDKFTFELRSPAQEQIDISVTDMAGRVITKATAATNQQKDIDLNAANGIYLLTATCPSGIYKSKIILSR